MTQQMGDRFKQISIRNIKNNSTTGSGLRGKGTGRRRVLDGIKKLTDIGVSPSNLVHNNLSPLPPKSSLLETEPTYQNTIELTRTLMSPMDVSFTSNKKKKEADETYMF